MVRRKELLLALFLLTALVWAPVFTSLAWAQGRHVTPEQRAYHDLLVLLFPGRDHHASSPESLEQDVALLGANAPGLGDALLATVSFFLVMYHLWLLGNSALKPELVRGERLRMDHPRLSPFLPLPPEPPPR